MSRSPAIALSCLAALLGGCEPEAPLGADVGILRLPAVDIPATIHGSLDLLFVVDDSENMVARQNLLVAAFDRLQHHLVYGSGTLPDLHVAVVSTDLGLGALAPAVDGCSESGEDGRLLTDHDASCSTTFGSYLSFSPRAGGAVDTNFEGSLTDAFGCAARLGQGGCEVEQPLAAMQRALDGTHAEGLEFLRPDAVLGVIFLTDEDDCSTTDPSLFDPDAPDRSGDLDFRCFRSGVICDGDDVFLPGRREGCRPRESSPFIGDVYGYAGFLEGLKEPGDLVVAGLIGDPDLVEVEISLDGMEPQLAPACLDESGAAAYPGVRLQAFLDAFPQAHTLAPLCNASGEGDEPFAALTDTASQLRRAMGTSCLQGDILDVDPTRAGIQADCWVSADDGDIDGPREIPACLDPAYPEGTEDAPCYTISHGGDEQCGDFETHLALTIHGGGAIPGRPGVPGQRIVASCLLETE